MVEIECMSVVFWEGLGRLGWGGISCIYVFNKGACMFE